MSNITDRERALLGIIDGGTPLCRYLFNVPPAACSGGWGCASPSVMEPCTASGPFPINQYPDLVERIRVMMAWRALEAHDDEAAPVELIQMLIDSGEPRSSFDEDDLAQLKAD